MEAEADDGCGSFQPSKDVHWLCVLFNASDLVLSVCLGRTLAAYGFSVAATVGRWSSFSKLQCLVWESGVVEWLWTVHWILMKD